MTATSGSRPPPSPPAPEIAAARAADGDGADGAAVPRPRRGRGEALLNLGASQRALISLAPDGAQRTTRMMACDDYGYSLVVREAICMRHAISRSIPPSRRSPPTTTRVTATRCGVR